MANLTAEEIAYRTDDVHVFLTMLRGWCYPNKTRQLEELAETMRDKSSKKHELLTAIINLVRIYETEFMEGYPK